MPESVPWASAVNSPTQWCTYIREHFCRPSAHARMCRGESALGGLNTLLLPVIEIRIAPIDPEYDECLITLERINEWLGARRTTCLLKLSLPAINYYALIAPRTAFCSAALICHDVIIEKSAICLAELNSDFNARAFRNSWYSHSGILLTLRNGCIRVCERALY